MQTIKKKLMIRSQILKKSWGLTKKNTKMRKRSSTKS